MRTAMTINMTFAIREAILSGTGFGILPDVLIADDIANHRLVELLPDWFLRTGGIYAVSPPSRLRIRAGRALLAMVTD